MPSCAAGRLPTYSGGTTDSVHEASLKALALVRNASGGGAWPSGPAETCRSDRSSTRPLCAAGAACGTASAAAPAERAGTPRPGAPPRPPVQNGAAASLRSRRSGRAALHRGGSRPRGAPAPWHCCTAAHSGGTGPRQSHRRVRWRRACAARLRRACCTGSMCPWPGTAAPGPSAAACARSSCPE